jgi:hypothetical protein
LVALLSGCEAGSEKIVAGRFSAEASRSLGVDCPNHFRA